MVSLTTSTISGNSASTTDPGSYAYGGGIDGQTVYLTSSTVSRNSSTGSVALGGGVFAFTANLTNATISGNSSSGSGGGVYVGRGPVSSGIVMSYCTVAANTVSAGKVGAGLALGNGASAALAGTLLHGNTGGNDIDVASGVVTLEANYNLIGSHGSNVTVPANTKSCDPMLGPLGDNGGPTKTHGLLSGSCAVDAAGTSPVTILGGIPIPNDQRGAGYLRVTGSAADIGAFEKQGPEDPDLIFADGFQP